jgi:hypothetical protein
VTRVEGRERGEEAPPIGNSGEALKLGVRMPSGPEHSERA